MSDPTDGWAKASEEIGGAAKEGIIAGREFGGFIAPAFRPLVGMVADQFNVWRLKRQVRLYEQYSKLLSERGLAVPSRAIKYDVLLPLIERASIEADDDLQNVWATMLTNAADADSGIEMRTAYVSMLGEMTHLDVLILAKLSTASSDPAFQGILPTRLLPERVGDDGSNLLPIGEVAVSLTNLGRLACIHPTSGLDGWVGFGRVTVSALGTAFVAACTAPPN